MSFVELNSALHDRESFDCGEPVLNRYLQEMALRHMRAGVSRTMVLPGQTVNEQGKMPISAWFTVAPGTVERENLPEQTAKRLPAYPIPVFLVGQLAVHKTMQGSGMGKITLIRALEYLYKVSKYMPAWAVVVDCLNPEVRAFYEQYGFRYLGMHRNNQRLYLPMQTIQKLLD